MIKHYFDTTIFNTEQYTIRELVDNIFGQKKVRVIENTSKKIQPFKKEKG